MNCKLLLFIRYFVIYCIFLVIFKNIHYIFFISYDSLLEYWFVFIPIAYLVVKYLIYYDVEKHKLLKRDFVFLAISFTIINILFSMPYVFSGCIALFVFVCKNKHVNDRNIISKNISDYYNSKKL